MKLKVALAVLLFHQACQALPVQDNESVGAMGVVEEKKAHQMAKLEAKLNDNLNQFLTALISVDLEEVKANRNYIQELIDATRDHSLNYRGVIENLPTLMNQPEEDQLVNFLKLLRKKVKPRAARFVFEALDSMLDLFSAIDIQQLAEIMRETPNFLQGMTEMISGVVDLIGDL